MTSVTLTAPTRAGRVKFMRSPLFLTFPAIVCWIVFGTVLAEFIRYSYELVRDYLAERPRR